MTQDELWLSKYHQLLVFIESNHRNPSKHNPEKRGLYYNRLHHNKKLLRSGKMKENRVEMFEKLLALMERYKRVNRFV
jgi:hypothetical protein